MSFDGHRSPPHGSSTSAFFAATDFAQSIEAQSNDNIYSTNSSITNCGGGGEEDDFLLTSDDWNNLILPDDINSTNSIITGETDGVLSCSSDSSNPLLFHSYGTPTTHDKNSTLSSSPFPSMISKPPPTPPLTSNLAKLLQQKNSPIPPRVIIINCSDLSKSNHNNFVGAKATAAIPSTTSATTGTTLSGLKTIQIPKSGLIFTTTTSNVGPNGNKSNINTVNHNIQFHNINNKRPLCSSTPTSSLTRDGGGGTQSSPDVQPHAPNKRFKDTYHCLPGGFSVQDFEMYIDIP